MLLAVPLGLLALRLTRFEMVGTEKFYTPNTVVALAVTLLFIGRIAYRLVTVLGAVSQHGPRPSTFENPLTLLVFGVTAGYYATYYFAVYGRGRGPAAK